MKASQSSRRYGLIAIFIALAFCFTNINQHAQIQSQYPTPSAHISDFANVLDENTRNRLETLLSNFKSKSKIDFYVATVENTGDIDIFDFSRRLATKWNLGARTSGSKSLLLVVAVSSRSSFTQFSRLVQPDLPDGVLGEMAQRMKAPISTGEFSEALTLGVDHFVNSLSQKLGFNRADIDRPIAGASAVESPSPTSTEKQAAPTEGGQTRPRLASASSEPVAVVKTVETSLSSPAAPEPTPKTVETSLSSPAAPEPTPKTVETSAAAPVPEPIPGNQRTKPTSKRATLARNERTPSATNAKKNIPPVNDEDESEEVELTLTLPLDKRAIKLKEFLATHPNSKSRPRAIELLISTYAGLGDQKLKNGDPAGIDDLLTAINEADTTISDQLFSGVISQIPANLYLRNEHAAAFKAAQAIETKFGADAKRSLGVASFYLRIERGDEAARIAEKVVKAAPDLAEAHRILAQGLHVSLQLEEAAAAYKRLLELDPNSRVARNSLADLNRGIGKPEEALALYVEQLKIDPKDKPAATGMVLSLLDLGRSDEAVKQLDALLVDDPRNLPLLTGAAYWFVAHGDFDKGFELARKAVEIEPRYTWAHVALARSFVGLKRPLDAERSLRYARQFGKFPTLNYELASVLSSMGLYDEALEVLRESFVVADGQIQTRLAGRFTATNENFVDLLAPERRASIYQNTAADSRTSAKELKDLLVFANALVPASDSQKIDEAAAVSAARALASGTDSRRVFRQIYASSRLLRNSVGFETAFELAEEAKKAAEDGLDVPAVSLAIQADEFRELRAKAIAAGNVPNVAEAPRATLGEILRGRSDDLMGWSLFNQAKYEPALTHLKTAATTLPKGTPSWRTATWHVGAALEQTGNDAEALENYILSYKAGEPDAIRRTTIEQVYRRLNGSLQGLDEKIGAASVATTPSSQVTSNPTSEPAPSSPNPEKSPTPSPSETRAETSTTKPSDPNSTPSSVPSPSPEPTASPVPDSPAIPTTTPSESPAPVANEDSARAAASRLRSIIKITGRVVDANKVGIGNVVVVLISPSGSVLASTTDMNGNYHFTVAPSQKTYRLIPSKDGFTFTPIDRTFAGLYDDQKEIDFVGGPK